MSLIDVGECAHNQADLDMFQFHHYAVIVAADSITRSMRKKLFMGTDGVLRADLELSDAWLERIRSEFVVKIGFHCIACCSGQRRVMFDRNFFMFCSSGDELGTRPGGVMCQGTIGPADLGWTPKARGKGVT